VICWVDLNKVSFQTFGVQLCACSDLLTVHRIPFDLSREDSGKGRMVLWN
jgi:hypothetical protein